MTAQLDLPAPVVGGPAKLPSELAQSTQKALEAQTLGKRQWAGIILSFGVLVISFGIGLAPTSKTPEMVTAQATDTETAPVEELLPTNVTLSNGTLPHVFAPYGPFEVPAPDTGGIDVLDFQGRPLIALVIDDLGLNLARSEEIAELGVPLTMSFLPYAPSLRSQIEFARVREHDIFAHIPMEPMQDNINVGRNALLTSMSKGQIETAVAMNLEPFTVLHGVNNHMGSRFTSDAVAMGALIVVLKSRNVLFLDSRTSIDTQGERIAKAQGLTGLRRHVFLDHEAPSDPAQILAQLAVLEREAERRGIAIAIGHPHRATIEALREWIPKAREKGFLFVRMRDVARQKEKEMSLTMVEPKVEPSTP